MSVEIKQSKTSTAKYAARYRTDCPSVSSNPRRHAEADGYYTSPQGWRMANYPCSSQGKHGGDAMASSGDSYGEGKRSTGGGY
jgi:hypothetical protein